MMKNLKKIVAIGCFLGMCLAATGIANAAPSDVEKQLQMMRQQMEMMQQKMMAMEQELQNTKQSAAQSQQAVEKQMTDVAGRFKALDDLTAKFGHIKLNGYVRSRWWTGDHQQSSFDVTEIALQLRYDVSQNISGEFHLWYHPSGNDNPANEYSNWAGPTTFFESAFAEFRNLNIPLGEELGVINGKLIVGKTRNQAFGIVPGGNYAGRVTSDYALYHTSINISRITGIQYLTSYKNFKWNFAVFNGWGYAGNTYNNAFGGRNAGIKQLAVAQENTDDNSNKAFSTRLAHAFPRNDYYDILEIGVSYLNQTISNNDRQNIYNIMGRGPATAGLLSKPVESYSKKDQKIALDFAYDKGPFLLKAEFARGETSDVDADYWYIMPGYCLSKVSKIPLDFFIRYSAADYDESTYASLSASGGWDKSQWTPLMVWTIHPRAKVYFEYYFNDQDEPGGVDEEGNDYGFIELILLY
jgi:hypothetical protein